MPKLAPGPTSFQEPSSFDEAGLSQQQACSDGYGDTCRAGMYAQTGSHWGISMWQGRWAGPALPAVSLLRCNREENQ